MFDAVMVEVDDSSAWADGLVASIAARRRAEAEQFVLIATWADHAVPYVPIDEGGPPGQTAPDNLGPLGRRHHLARTFDGFTVHQPAVGIYYWRTPTGHWHLVDPRGTRPLGRRGEPAAVTTAARLDPTPMSNAERHFREQILRGLAA